MWEVLKRNRIVHIYPLILGWHMSIFRKIQFSGPRKTLYMYVLVYIMCQWQENRFLKILEFFDIFSPFQSPKTSIFGDFSTVFFAYLVILGYIFVILFVLVGISHKNDVISFFILFQSNNTWIMWCLIVFKYVWQIVEPKIAFFFRYCTGFGSA